MRVFGRCVIAVLTFAAAMAGIPPAGADQFDWSQNAGFLLPGADAVATETLMAGSFFGAQPQAPNVDHGGLEFFGAQPAPAPADTYSTIAWGCVADGNNSPGVTDCANGGVLANAVVGVDPTPAPGVNGRSLLKVTVFDSGASGVLDSVTEAPVVIARLDHINRVIDNEANALYKITVSANLVINELGPGPEVITNPNTVPITFLETNNIPAGQGSTAADCVAAGLTNPLGSVCDDEFTFDVSSFQNVPFSHNGKNFFLQFGLGPVPECSTFSSSIGTIDIFQCADNPAHRIAIDFINGKAWAMEGFDNAIQVTMFLTEEPVPPPLRTVTQGGWGAPPNGQNNGQFLATNFAALGGPVVIGNNGGPHTLTFTSASAIEAFLPQGGKPRALTGSATNPTGKFSVFAGQVLALTLNVAFSDLGLLPPGLGALILTSGPAAGKTVAQVLADAHKALGGGGLPSYVTSIAQLNDVVAAINEAFAV